MNIMKYITSQRYNIGSQPQGYLITTNMVHIQIYIIFAQLQIIIIILHTIIIHVIHSTLI